MIIVESPTSFGFGGHRTVTIVQVEKGHITIAQLLCTTECPIFIT